MSRFTNFLDIPLAILNMKLANLIVFLLSLKYLLNCSNALNWQILLEDQVNALELINNPLNLVLSYCKSVNEFEIY